MSQATQVEHNGPSKEYPGIPLGLHRAGLSTPVRTIRPLFGKAAEPLKLIRDC
jgi:hypothetical protein